MTSVSPAGRSRRELAERVAQDLVHGTYVNLGIGMPEIVAECIPPDREVILHTENGMLGMGPTPTPSQLDPDLINAGKQHVTAMPGASFFHQADSFAMIRGGHIDLCVLGAMQVAANGDLANWSTGDVDAIPGVGGAMDLVAGAKLVYVMTTHCTRRGEPKLVEACTYPLTGKAVVSRVYTDLAVIDITSDGFALRELAPGISLHDVRDRTAAPIHDVRRCADTAH